MLIARQRVGKQVTAEWNTRATTDALPFLCNGEVTHTSITEKFLGNGVFCWELPEVMYNEDLRQLTEET